YVAAVNYQFPGDSHAVVPSSSGRRCLTRCRNWYGRADDFVEHAKTVIANWFRHGSPQPDRSLFDHFSIIPELDGVPAVLRKSTVPNSDRKADNFQWVLGESNRELMGFENLLAGVL